MYRVSGTPSPKPAISSPFTHLTPIYLSLIHILRAQTDKLRDRLQMGESTDDILPDAFAVCREACDRVLGMRPFPVQILGGIILHQGRIAEMKTGEGKTLVATCLLYTSIRHGLT